MFFYEAYSDLATCRLPGGSIPWTAALAYGQHKGLAPDVLDITWAIVQKMDLAERRWQVELADRKAPPQGGPTGG